MTTLVSDKTHLFAGWRDIGMDKLRVFHFLKKVTNGYLNDAKNCQNPTFKVIFLCQKSMKKNLIIKFFTNFLQIQIFDLV